MFGKDIWFIVIYYLHVRDRRTLLQVSKYINTHIGKYIKSFQYDKIKVQYKKTDFSYIIKSDFYNVVSKYKVDYRNRIQGTLEKQYFNDPENKGNLITNTNIKSITIFKDQLGDFTGDIHCITVPIKDKSYHYIDNQRHGWKKDTYINSFMWKNVFHGPSITYIFYARRKMYKLGVLHGYSIDYYGEKEYTEEGNYVNGHRDGPWISWALHDPDRICYIDMYEMGVLKNRSGYYELNDHIPIGPLRYYTEFKVAISEASEIDVSDEDESGIIYCHSKDDPTDYSKYNIPNITRYYKLDGTEYKVTEE